MWFGKVMFIFQQTGAIVIVVGIGSNVKQSELDAIASDSEHKFNVASFDFLDKIHDQLVFKACKGE